MDAAERAARIVRTIVETLKPGFAVGLWNGERIGPATVRCSRSTTATRSRRLVRRPKFTTLVELWISRAVDVEDGSLFDIIALRPEGKLRAKLKTAEAAAAARPAGARLREQLEARRRACRPQPVRQRLEQGSDRASLRHLERLLPALPRRAHGLQLRLFHRFRQQHRPGAGRQAGAHLPQAAAEAGRDAARHRLRLGRDADLCREALWRRRPRRLAVGGADRARPRAHPRRRPGRPHHHRDQILPNSTAASTRSRRSACSSMSALPITTPISRPSTGC